MAIGISFDKQKAEYLVECLSNGAPIEGIESTEDMLALIGACGCVIAGRLPNAPPGTNYRKLPSDRRRQVRADFADDVQAAIRWYTEVTRMVVDGRYDSRFESQHYAVAERSAGGEHSWKVVVTRGSKPDRSPVVKFDDLIVPQARAG